VDRRLRVRRSWFATSYPSAAWGPPDFGPTFFGGAAGAVLTAEGTCGGGLATFVFVIAFGFGPGAGFGFSSGAGFGPGAGFGFGPGAGFEACGAFVSPGPRLTGTEAGGASTGPRPRARGVCVLRSRTVCFS
jgi:hypothetical protein